MPGVWGVGGELLHSPGFYGAAVCTVKAESSRESLPLELRPFMFGLCRKLCHYTVKYFSIFDGNNIKKFIVFFIMIDILYQCRRIKT